MSRLVTSLALMAVACVTAVPSALAQTSAPLSPSPAHTASAHQLRPTVTGQLYGTVSDERGRPVTGAVVSALGTGKAFAVTDSAGRFGFSALAPGPYLLRAYLQGYAPVRSALVQINSGTRTAHTIKIARRGASELLSAGVGGAPTGTAGEPSSAVGAPASAVGALSGSVGEPSGANGEPSGDVQVTDDDHSELAWRLRHLKRGVLDDVEVGTPDLDDSSLFGDSLATIGRAMSASARYASAMISDLPLTGQLNLLTATTLNRPQDLFSLNGPPHGVAYLSLVAPTTGGDWSMRGALTQGDLSSWVLAGSYVRHALATHAYESGLSYTMQRYAGGNAVALAAMSDGSRNAGMVYGYDNWRIGPAVTLTYGARYARYDYLEQGGLLSPRVAMTVNAGRNLRLRASASRRQLAPGAEEFQPPSGMDVWAPPERTFSSLSADGRFRPERVEHYEMAGEQTLPGGLTLGLRTFAQEVDDQLITVFGVNLPHSAAADVGHYYVGSSGDLSTRGWSVSVSRTLVGKVRGSVDYTEARAVWERRTRDLETLSLIAPSFVRTDRERLRDLTASIDAEIPATATHMYVLYRAHTSAANIDAGESRPAPLRGTRFDVEVRQALPFLKFTNAEWAMLVAVKNVFREDRINASVYDELLVVRPPKRIVGGLTVRF